MKAIKYGKDLAEERIDLRICPESHDLGRANTSGTPETALGVDPGR
jgi:hypothetical protein